MGWPPPPARHDTEIYRFQSVIQFESRAGPLAAGGHRQGIFDMPKWFEAFLHIFQHLIIRCFHPIAESGHDNGIKAHQPLQLGDQFRMHTVKENLGKGRDKVKILGNLGPKLPWGWAILTRQA